jgi:hypothetical protein
MRFTTAAIVLGVVVGLVTGGRLSNLGRRSFNAWPLLAAGIGLQLLPWPLALAASYLCLIAFAVLNLHVPGFGLLTVGLALNAVVVIVNGGMPVHNAVPLGAKHHLEGPGDHLTFLDDRFDIAALGEVLSLGDLVMAVGLVAAMAAVVRRPPQGRHAADGQLADDSGSPRLR